MNGIDDFLFETDNLFDLSISSIKQIGSNLSNLQNFDLRRTVAIVNQ